MPHEELNTGGEAAPEREGILAAAYRKAEEKKGQVKARTKKGKQEKELPTTEFLKLPIAPTPDKKETPPQNTSGESPVSEGDQRNILPDRIEQNIVTQYRRLASLVVKEGDRDRLNEQYVKMLGQVSDLRERFHGKDDKREGPLTPEEINAANNVGKWASREMRRLTQRIEARLGSARPTARMGTLAQERELPVKRSRNNEEDAAGDVAGKKYTSGVAKPAGLGEEKIKILSPEEADKRLNSLSMSQKWFIRKKLRGNPLTDESLTGLIGHTFKNRKEVGDAYSAHLHQRSSESRGPKHKERKESFGSAAPPRTVVGPDVRKSPHTQESHQRFSAPPHSPPPSEELREIQRAFNRRDGVAGGAPPPGGSPPPSPAGAPPPRRPFMNIETAREESRGVLGRTANSFREGFLDIAARAWNSAPMNELWGYFGRAKIKMGDRSVVRVNERLYNDVNERAIKAERKFAAQNTIVVGFQSQLEANARARAEGEKNGRLTGRQAVKLERERLDLLEQIDTAHIKSDEWREILEKQNNLKAQYENEQREFAGRTLSKIQEQMAPNMRRLEDLRAQREGFSGEIELRQTQRGRELSELNRLETELDTAANRGERKAAREAIRKARQRAKEEGDLMKDIQNRRLRIEAQMGTLDARLGKWRPIMNEFTRATNRQRTPTSLGERETLTPGRERGEYEFDRSVSDTASSPAPSGPAAPESRRLFGSTPRTAEEYLNVWNTNFGASVLRVGAGTLEKEVGRPGKVPSAELQAALRDILINNPRVSFGFFKNRVGEIDLRLKKIREVFESQT